MLHKAYKLMDPPPPQIPSTIKIISFNLANQMGLKGNFNKVKQRSGKYWFHLRKTQALSEARGKE